MPTSYVIQSSVRIFFPEARVKELIDEDTMWLNLNMIHEVYNADEVARIYSLALSPNGQEDKLMWIENANGNFSIRTAYHLESWERGMFQGFNLE
jgi:hypothetical protein